MPPFTLIACPVMRRAPGLARNKAIVAKSSASATPRCAIREAFSNILALKGSAKISAAPGVPAISDGVRRLMRIPGASPPARRP